MYCYFYSMILGGDPSAFGVCIFSICTGISLYFLISWPFQMGSHWWHWKWCLYLYICTGISLYFLFEQWRDHFVLWQWWQGGPSAFGVCIFIYALVFPYIFLLNSEEITLCSGSDDRGVHLPLVSTCFLYALVFPYIFLLVDCFEWALIDCIARQRVYSELWQFRIGGIS